MRVPSVAIRLVEDDDRRKIDMRSIAAGQTALNSPRTGNAEAWFITEAGFYDLVFASKAKGAKAFKRWVTHIADKATRLVREAAKLLGMREIDLRRFLLDEGFIFAKHAQCGDIMYDLYAEHAHHFIATETVVNHSWGTCSHYTLRITPRGIDLIRKRLAKVTSA